MRLSSAFRPGWRSVMATIVMFACVVGPAGAQSDQSDPAQLLEDFVFYALTANPDLSAASGRALIESGLTDEELAVLLDEEGKTTVERFDAAVQRAQRLEDHPELESVAAELAHRIEDGRLGLARDPERIKKAIEDLTGHQRQRLLARNRLVAAGEFAVPALLDVIVTGQDERLKNQCIDVLVSIGAEAVTPLCAALPELGDPVAQRVVCDVLAAIGYPHAAPTLRDVAADATTAAPVREAAERAFRRVATPDWTGLTLSGLYTRLGTLYFEESESLIAYPYEETNNVWEYEPFIGLAAVPVPTTVFGEVMAMRSALEAIEEDPDDRQALALFVAGNLKRENELEAGQVDPEFGESTYTPDFYATVFGTATCQDVLAMALDRLNTPLVRDAIGALSETTGGSNLFESSRSRNPLLESLQYPDRRARYEAALTLARALPQRSFASDFTVVPLLASAVRSGNRQFAVVIAPDREEIRVLSVMLEDLGFEIVAAAEDVNMIQNEIAESIGVDLVVLRQSDPEAAQRIVSQLRQVPKTAAAPVLLQAGALDIPRLRPEYRGDRRVLVARTHLDETMFETQVEEVMQRGAGGRITEIEAESYAIEALDALRDIAISGSPAYQIIDAESALLEALDVRTGGTRLLVADILALINTDRAQRALFDAALNTTDESEQIDLLDRLADSVKRHGNRAEPRHVAALTRLVQDSAGATAEAAARVRGALNLPAGDAIELLPKLR